MNGPSDLKAKAYDLIMSIGYYQNEANKLNAELTQVNKMIQSLSQAEENARKEIAEQQKEITKE